MRYMYVKWFHNFEDEPVELYHEINDDGYENRKIELGTDNRLIGFALDGKEFGDTILSDQKIPIINDINKDPQFEATEIKKEIFEIAWQKYAH